MSDAGQQELVVARPDVAVPAPIRGPKKRRARRIVSALVMLGLAGGAAWAAKAKLWPAAADEYLTVRATHGPFTYEVTERGELESSANLEIRCEVESRDGKGMKIIEIVPEGSMVKEADLLVRFEDAGLRNERTVQQIAVNTAQAAATQARNEFESAEFAKREYEFGTFIQEEEKAESEMFVAQENLRRSEEYHRYSKKLESRGYSSPAAVEADAFAVEKCRKELGVAETKLKVLREYTRLKTLKKHDADIKTAQAKQTSEETKLELETSKLAVIDEQIEKCIVKAPRSGQVVYDHDQDQWRGSDYAIKEGTVVYERRVIMRMPDATKMRVKAKVAESKIDRLKTGMPATIQIEGLPGVTLQGCVSKVNDFPAEGNWFNSAVKEYETMVDVTSPPPGLRPGMTAQVAIRVESLPEAIQVPVQAVAEINGKHYCLIKERGGALSPRPVTLGTSNDKFLVIRDGVAKDDELLLDPRSRLAKMMQPTVPATEKAADTATTTAVAPPKDSRT
jgi:HlyD family secretion protein